MDAKSGSVLPTTPRIKGISMVSATRWHTNGKFSNSMRYHTQPFGRMARPVVWEINDRLALASQRSVPGERTPAIAGLKCRILLTCGCKTILPYGMTSCYASNNYQQKACVSKVGGQPILGTQLSHNSQRKLWHKDRNLYHNKIKIKERNLI